MKMAMVQGCGFYQIACSVPDGYAEYPNDCDDTDAFSLLLIQTVMVIHHVKVIVWTTFNLE